MELISQREFAKRMGVSPQAVQDAIKRNKLTLIAQPDGKPKVPWPDAKVEWAKRGNPSKIKRSDSKEETMSWADAKARKDAAQAKLAELQLAQKKGELLERTLVERQAFECGRRVRDAILNVPNRLADQLAAETDRFKVHTLITAELTKALEELASANWDEVSREAGEVGGEASLDD